MPRRRTRPSPAPQRARGPQGCTLSSSSATWESALARFREAAEIAPDDPWPRLHEAAALRALGRPADAREALGRIPPGSPPWAQALQELGHLDRQEGRDSSALARFAEAAALAPQDPWPRL